MLRDDESLFEVFIEDLYEQLSFMDNCFLEVEREENSDDNFNSLFRVCHSLKGVFYTMEYQSLGDFFHRLEAIVQSCGKIHSTLDPNFVQLMIDFREDLEIYISNLKADHSTNFEIEPYSERLAILETKLAECLREKEDQNQIIPPRQLLYNALKKSELTYLQMIDSNSKIIDSKAMMEAFTHCDEFAKPLQSEQLTQLFKTVINFLSYYEGQGKVLDHLAEGLIMETFDWAMQLIDLTKPLSKEDERHFLVHLDMMQAQRIEYLQQLQDDRFVPHTDSTQKLGEILVKQGKVQENELQAIIDKQKNSDAPMKLGEALVSENKVKVRDIANALQAQTQIKKQNDSYTFIRIPEQRVDVLLDGMEELMVMQSQLKEKLRRRWIQGDESAKVQLDRIDRMLILLQHQAVSFRLQSLDNTFKKIEIIGRSAAKDLGKDVFFQLEGTEVEVSKSIVERLQNPLLHLVRNAVYHGIETPEERKNKGKKIQGLLKVSGRIDKNQLLLSISDDGKGFNLDQILEKAIDNQIADRDRTYAPWEIMDFIFEPGFTTLQKADTISGRGMGMNIVETEIKALGGHIEIQNRPNQGVSFVLNIPLHTENLQGYLFMIKDEKLILPSEYVKEIIPAKSVAWVINNHKCKQVYHSDSEKFLPIITVLEQSDDIENLMNEDVIVITIGGTLKALPVTKVIRELGVFVNPVDELKEHDSIFKGVAVINEHEFALILDVPKILSVQ